MRARSGKVVSLRATVALMVTTLALLLALCTPNVAASSYLFNNDVSFAAKQLRYVAADPYRASSELLNFDIRSLPLIALNKKELRGNKDAKKSITSNLGMLLRGNRASPTIFAVKPLKSVNSTIVRSLTMKRRSARLLVQLCRKKYMGSFSLGSLSGIHVYENNTLIVESTYPIGEYINQGMCRITNSFGFRVFYKTEEGGDGTSHYTVTGFIFDAGTKDNATVDIKDFSTSSKSPNEFHMHIYYSVEWVLDQDESFMKEVRNSAFEEQEHHRHQRGHFISSLNVLLIWTVVGVLAITTLFRSVRRDLMEDAADPEQIEDMPINGKWKLVQGDVFRPPSHAIAFAAAIGAGAQLIFMVVLTFLCSVMGVMHPSQRGALLTGLVFTYIFSSSICGFVVARLLKFFKVVHNLKALIVALFLPVTLSVGYLILNFIQWALRTGVATPISAVALLLFLELFCAIPLVVVGVVFGYRKGELSVPCKPTALPRLIPAESKRSGNALTLVSGVLPFLASFIELTYVLDSLWQNYAFFRLNVLFWQALVILFLCAEISIVVTYLTLSQQNYMWWWKSFLSVASCGLYVFLYSLYYMFRTLGVRRPVSIVLFMGYMGGFSFIVALVTGTVGFISSFLFVRTIYSASKSS